MAAQFPPSESSAEERSEKQLVQETDELLDGDSEKDLTDQIDLLKTGDGEKSLQALKCMVEVLSTNYFPEFLEERVPAISCILEGIIKTGTPSNAVWAAKVAALMFAQCNEKSEYTTYINILHPALISSFNTIAEACSESDTEMYVAALGICGFVFTTHQVIVDIRERFISLAEDICKKSYRHDSISEESSSLCCTLLRLVGLMLIATSFRSLPSTERWSWLQQFLECPNININIAAGELVILVDELYGNEAESEEFEDLALKCRTLANKPNKRLDRTDQRKQLSAFSNVVNILAGRSSIYTECRFGSETLYVDSYTALLKYRAFRQLFTHGMLNQILENKYLRRILNHTGACSKKATKALYAGRAKSREKERKADRDAKREDCYE